ncbi:hypothetical protein NKH77_53460 [Streptomyces sp. M19]
MWLGRGAAAWWAPTARSWRPPGRVARRGSAGVHTVGRGLRRGARHPRHAARHAPVRAINPFRAGAGAIPDRPSEPGLPMNKVWLSNKEVDDLLGCPSPRPPTPTPSSSWSWRRGRAVLRAAGRR